MYRMRESLCIAVCVAVVITGCAKKAETPLSEEALFARKTMAKLNAEQPLDTMSTIWSSVSAGLRSSGPTWSLSASRRTA